MKKISFLVITLSLIASSGFAQYQYNPMPQQQAPMQQQAPPSPPQAQPPQMTPQYPPQQQYPQPQQQIQQQPMQQQNMQYAFRPDLTNPEYGACLQMEKQWKALYQRYYQEYERVRVYGYQAGQSAAYLQNLRMQMEAAWNAFSSKCVYFPKRKP